MSSIYTISHFMQVFSSGLNSSNIFISLFALIIYAVAISIIFSIYAYVFGYLERKVIAKAQHRHGPTYVGPFGFLQNLADLVKLIAKERVVPADADKLLFDIMPILLVAVPIFVIFLLPFSPSLQATNFGLGLLIAFVLIGFTPIMLFIAAVASGNKFADIGAQRSVLMLISYEVPMMIVIATIALVTRSYSFQQIIAEQSPMYFGLLMPIGLFVFFIVMLAEMERPPFDLREADSELIAGWMTDLSAPYYALMLLLDYTRMFLGSLLIVILFFGGWSGPILPPIVWLIAKAFIVSFFIIIIRATVVRMRIDRILRFGWIWLLPLSLLNLILTYMLIFR